jgi:hypothetical protein
VRLSKERVAQIAGAIATRLSTGGLLEITGPKQSLVDALTHAMTEELLVEDRLNAEVRELMKKYEREIEQGRVDYQKMFSMIKKQLVKERGIIL